MSTNINMTMNLEIGVEEEEVGQSSINYQAHFETSIAQLKAENRYRIFANLERDAERFPKALWRPDDKAIEPRDVTIWCSNDYLGMGGHSKIRAAAQDAIGRLILLADLFRVGDPTVRRAAHDHHGQRRRGHRRHDEQMDDGRGTGKHHQPMLCVVPGDPARNVRRHGAQDRSRRLGRPVEVNSGDLTEGRA